MPIHTHTVCETSVVAGRPRGIGTGDCREICVCSEKKEEEDLAMHIKQMLGLLVNNILSDN